MANGDDDMPSGSPIRSATQQLAIDDTRTALAALKVQVGGIEKDYGDLKITIVSLDRKLEAGMTTLNNALQGAISAINNKLDDRQKTPWSALGVMLSAFVAFVAFAYWPIHTTEDELKASLTTLSKDFSSLLTAIPDRYVNMREHDRLIKQVDIDIGNTKKDLVSRAEHEQHWASIREREDGLQKQLDAIRTDFGGVFTMRDQLQRLQHEIDQLHTTNSHSSNMNKSQS